MSMKVLVIDPDPQFLYQVRGFLEPRGHLTLHESEPVRACRRAERWKPDLAILSAELVGRRNGEILKRLGRLQPRPAILLTARLDQFRQAWRAWQQGGDEMLFKPLMHPSELHVAIVTALQNTVCPRRRPAAERPTAVPA